MFNFHIFNHFKCFFSPNLQIDYYSPFLCPVLNITRKNKKKIRHKENFKHLKIKLTATLQVFNVINTT